MTKLSIFDRIEEAKKFTVLSQNDKIEHFWQNLRGEKKNTRTSHKMTKLSIFDKIEKRKKYMGLFIMTKLRIFNNIELLKNRKKETPASHKMTKLSIFDKIEEAKKSTVLSQNDKI